MGIKVYDIVGRKSYGMDIYFKVMNIKEDDQGNQIAYLKGLDTRLCASGMVSDLVKIEPAETSKRWRNTIITTKNAMYKVFSRRRQERALLMRSGLNIEQLRQFKFDKGKKCLESFDMPGRVLHVDGDGDYLALCMTTYRQQQIPADGVNIAEEDQADRIYDLLTQFKPDLLVLTGHDGFVKSTKNFSDIRNYYNSGNFVNAVKEARRYEKSRDELVIFAGACQSHYESLLAAGANFASSPLRVMIHAFDPVFIMEKIAFTSIYDPISLQDVIAGTITGFDGIGGMETRGKYRMGAPRSPY